MQNGEIWRYLRRALPAMLLIFVVATLMVHFQKSLGTLGRSGFLVALMLSYVWAGWVEFSQLRRCDELRRRLELEAMMLSFIVAFGVILCLFFANALKLVSVSFVVAPGVMLASYVACQLWARLRYRYWALL